ncbi:MAG TPA: hypothetical protein VLQ93_21680, partial [Myxococcaceae bacterium]|nr:hypothetical protein [Myxococcaceae bacterium]
MADNVRDVIRSAQAAELGGDKPRAIELLRLAASLYQRAGSSSRALSLLRYALKLEPSRSELLAEVEQLESLSGEGEGSETPSSGSLVAAESAMGAALASVDSEADEEGGVWVIEEAGSSLEDALREAERAVTSREIPHPSPLPE